MCKAHGASVCGSSRCVLADVWQILRHNVRMGIGLCGNDGRNRFNPAMFGREGGVIRSLEMDVSIFLLTHDKSDTSLGSHATHDDYDYHAECCLHVYCIQNPRLCHTSTHGASSGRYRYPAPPSTFLSPLDRCLDRQRAVGYDLCMRGSNVLPWQPRRAAYHDPRRWSWTAATNAGAYCT